VLPEEPDWVVVVPVKELRLAKTRLGLSDAQRGDVALAMAVDVVASALACSAVTAVTVVTNDLRAAAELTGLGARVVADTADAGLNPALDDGARISRAWHPRAGVAALSSDVAALTPTDLGDALRCAAATPRAFVADRNGSGTTLLTARAGVDLAPQFGSGSRHRHLTSGAAELPGDWPGLRTDVDTVDDLRLAAQGELGERTRRVAVALGLLADGNPVATS
jgi:2-phospho-L-lactate/phosphoenolpyruvate guanylyltransferase